MDTRYIEEGEKSTGIAKIIVEENGQNRILVVAGANSEVDKAYIDRHLDVIKECDIVVAQLEIPVETVAYALAKAKESFPTFPSIVTSVPSFPIATAWLAPFPPGTWKRFDQLYEREWSGY